jgi:methyltransferase (TIGR00027 family)
MANERDESPSRTALGVAGLRAAHQILDSPPLILDDPVALRILGPELRARLEAGVARLQAPGARALRSHVVLRSRYAEDRLALAVARGVQQYVILGAGYDTFIVRQPPWAAGIHIVEIDRPETQADKRLRLERAGLRLPANVTLHPVDFGAETLSGALADAGLERNRPAFFSWLGVTMYLAVEAVTQVLADVAAFATGSEIVLTFAPPDDKPSGSNLAQAAAAVGEPWRSYFTPEKLETMLRAAGFASVTFLTPERASVYYQDRGDGLPPPRRSAIASAMR